ncbi:G-protein coupled receptor moody-like [Amphiura filiformis]|uniref:G-protein coupled receptor moody-like n=1 Tax=Amphiura filiformis TaxID=82378 RepID=UPI003B20D418
MESVIDYEYDFVFDDYNQHIVVATAFLIASILGIIGNSLVILSMFVSRKLRTVTNAFVVNLSIADFITALIIPWNVGILLGHEEYPIKDWGCAIVSGLQYICTATSLFTLATIAVNRLVLITQPAKTYRYIYSPVCTGIWIAATWFVPFCVIIIPPLAGVGELGTSQKYRLCTHKSRHPLKDTYDYIQVIGCFPVPLITLIVSYSWIYIHLHRHTQKLIHHGRLGVASGESSSGDTLAMSESGTLTADTVVQNNIDTAGEHGKSQVTGKQGKVSNAEARLRQRENTITKNMFMAFIGFIICNTPSAILLFSNDIKPLAPYALALILSNCCVNPFIYGFKHPYFNQVFRCLLTCRWDKVPEQSDEFKKLRRFCCGRQ